MQDNNTNATGQNTQQDFIKQANEIAEEVKKVNQGITEDNAAANAWMDDIEKKVDKNIGDLEEIYTDLDKADKEAEDALDDVARREKVDLENDEDLGE
jgi:hypothetical protein